MGIRFRKSIKVAPGVKVNVGQKSVGVSVGGKHGGVSVNSKTGARARVSAPGTGLSYTTKIGTEPAKTPNEKEKNGKKPKNYYQKLSIIAFACGIIGLLLSCIIIGVLPATIGLVLSAICLIQKSGNKKMAFVGLSSSLASVLIFIIIISAPSTPPGNTDKLISSSSGSSGNTDASSLLASATPTPVPTMAPTPMPTTVPMSTSEPTPLPTPIPTEAPTIQPTVEPQTPSDNEFSGGSGSGDASNFNTYNNTNQQQTAETYVLNTSSNKIHHPDCSSVPKIAPQNYATSNESIADLQAQGYSTCGICFK